MSGLAHAWARFLQSPKIDQLTDDAILTYITSCKQFVGAKNVINQMSINSEGLKSRKDEVACYHEGPTSLVSEVAASFIFEFDGKLNPFLPGLDDNMFSGRRVEMPMVYTVLFAGEKIRSIRIFWDQATVLKQIDVIGTRGRGWPIYDGPEQSRFLKEGPKPELNQKSDAGPRATTGTHDPHASLNLYEHQKEAPRTDYGPQDYQQPRVPESRDYNELFVNESSARPDELTQRLGQGHRRQVTLGQSINSQAEEGMRKVNLNESVGQAGRTSHFEFGTPDVNASAFQKNEIPLHHKGGMKDHNESTEDYYAESFQSSTHSGANSQFALPGQSPVPQGSRRGPPSAQYDLAAAQAPEHNVHGREYNMGRRPPPEPQFDAFTEQAPETNIHGREYNMSRRPPPQSQYNFLAGDEDSNAAPAKPSSRAASHQYAQEQREAQGQDEPNVHNREYNMSRRPPPQAQYDFMNDSAADSQAVPASKSASQRQFTPTEQPENIHGREFNMSRRPPPQAQYDFMADAGSTAPEQSFGRASQRRFTPTEEPENVYGREYNMSRRPPPQAQYDFMGDSGAPPEQFSGRTSQRNFTPSYDLGDGSDNVHGREYNMGRRGPPAPQNNLFE